MSKKTKKSIKVKKKCCGKVKKKGKCCKKCPINFERNDDCKDCEKCPKK